MRDRSSWVKRNRRKCVEATQRYYKTKRGLINAMYNTQKKTSRRRKHTPSEYTFEELLEWVINQPIFHELFENWIKSGYQKFFVPSCDRLDNNIGYKFSNIRVVTFYENCRKQWYNPEATRKRMETCRLKGIRSPGSSTFTDQQVLDIRKKWADGMKVKEIVKELGLKRDGGVRNIVKRQTFKWL